MARASKKSGAHSASKPAVRSAAASAIRPAILVVVRVLLLLALGVSAYLAWVSLTHGSLAGCGAESDCDRVLQSRWSRWFGVPVSGFAVVVDALTLWGTFAMGSASELSRMRGWHVAVLGSLLILGAGIWFVILQVAAVGICPYCMTAHGAGMAGALLLLIVAGRSASSGWLARTAPAAATVLSILIAGQLVQKAPGGRESKLNLASSNLPPVLPAVVTQTVVAASSTQTVVTPPPGSSSNGLQTAVGSNSAPAVPATNAVRQTYTVDMGPVTAMKRPFKFYDGLFAVDLEELPVMGTPTNARVVISLFDYSCHHCRAMHPVIEEVQRAFSNDLVVVSLPMPLDEKCNHTMKRTPPAHVNACVYAHLGLAVWRANRARHAEFEDWMMTGAEAPPVQAAVARAISLVGSNAFAAAVRDPWVSRQVQFDVAIYDVAYRSGHGSMPQLIVGKTLSEGMRLREQVLKMVEDELGLKPRP